MTSPVRLFTELTTKTGGKAPWRASGGSLSCERLQSQESVKVQGTQGQPERGSRPCLVVRLVPVIRRASAQKRAGAEPGTEITLGA